MSILVLVFSASAALISALGIYVFERMIDGGLSSVLGIGIIFALSGAVFFLLILAANYFQSSRTGYSFANCKKTVLLVSAVAVAGLGIAGILFEFLYELAPAVDEREIQDVVFIMDRSASMSYTDPNLDSKNALKRYALAHTGDNEIMIAEFSNDGRTVLPFTVNNEENYPLIEDAVASMSEPDGGTYIREALALALEEIGNRADASRNADIVIVSDGEIADLSPMQAKAVMRPFVAAGVRISTVGTDSVNEALMTRISSLTGGTFMMVDDFSSLEENIDRTLNAAVANGNLLTVRSDIARQKDIYVIMRLLFLTLLGAALNTVGSMLIYASMWKTWMILLRAAAGAFAAALITELFAAYDKNITLYMVFMLLNMLLLVVLAKRTVISGNSPAPDAEHTPIARKSKEIRYGK